MQNMSMDILSRLHELACDIALESFSKSGVKVRFDAADTKTCPGMPSEDPKYDQGVNFAADQQLQIRSCNTFSSAYKASAVLITVF